MDKLLSIADVAERLGLCEKKIYQLVLAKQLPHVRIGKAIRFTEAQLAAYIEACTTR